MKRVTPALATTITATLLTLGIAVVTLWVFPPGKAEAQRYNTANELLAGHIGVIDERVAQAEWGTGEAIACPTEWLDETTAGGRRYTLGARVTFAHHDPNKRDFVPTCDEEAEYHIIEVSAEWPGAPVPTTTTAIGPRYYFMPDPEPELETTTPLTPGQQFEDGPYLGILPLADPPLDEE